MSDQAATQKSFNKMLSDFKAESLPAVRENWDHLTQDQKTACGRICNFYCGLHILINLADVTNSALSKYEAATENLKQFNRKSKKGESGVVRLIRTVCYGEKR